MKFEVFQVVAAIVLLLLREVARMDVYELEGLQRKQLKTLGIRSHEMRSEGTSATQEYSPKKQE